MQQLRQMCQSLRLPTAKELVSLRMVRKPQQPALPPVTRLPRLIFQDKRAIPTQPQRVAIVQTHIPSERDDHLCRLAAVLQRSRCRTLFRSSYQDKKLYHQYGVDILKDGLSLPGVSLQFLLRGTHQQHEAPNLFAPNNDAYDILKTRSPVVKVLHLRDITKPESHASDPIKLIRVPAELVNVRCH